MGEMTKKGLALMAAVLITAAAGQAQAETRFAVQDSNAADKMVVTDQGQVGIGITAPLYPLHIKAGGPTSATTIEFHNQGNSSYSAFDTPAFQLMRNNRVGATYSSGTISSTIPRPGDRLGNFAFGSYLNNVARYSAFISAFADPAPAAWTNTSYPGYLSFQTAGTSDVYPAEKMRLTSTGNLGVGIPSPQQRVEVAGGVRLNTAAGKPACNDTTATTTRGTLWFTQGGSGVADTLEVCSKDSSGGYAWRSLIAAP